jgi:hypothetical protein
MPVVLLIWTASSSIGALIAALNLFDAYGDLRALGPVQNGRRIIARGWVRSEAIRLGIQLAWALVGVLALLMTRPGPAPISILTLILIGTNVALATNTILDARERLALRRLLQ